MLFFCFTSWYNLQCFCFYLCWDPFKSTHLLLILMENCCTTLENDGCVLQMLMMGSCYWLFSSYSPSTFPDVVLTLHTKLVCRATLEVRWSNHFGVIQLRAVLSICISINLTTNRKLDIIFRIMLLLLIFSYRCVN